MIENILTFLSQVSRHALHDVHLCFLYAIDVTV